MVRKLDLKIGSDTEGEPVPLRPPDTEITRKAPEHEHEHGEPAINEYQAFAIILSLVAVGYAFYLRKKSV